MGDLVHQGTLTSEKIAPDRPAHELTGIVYRQNHVVQMFLPDLLVQVKDEEI